MYASIFSLVGFGGLGFGVWALVSGLWMSGFGFLALVSGLCGFGLWGFRLWLTGLWGVWVLVIKFSYD